MANEMDLGAEAQRLRGVYGEMGDRELLELAEKPDELTDIAREVLGREMTARGLEVVREEEEPEADFPELGLSVTRSGRAFLNTFHDALQAGDACAYLEEVDIEFEVIDRSEPQEGLRRYGNGPAIALEVNVAAVDRDRAMAILRKRMGLFPLQEVDEADEWVDDGTRAVAGSFETKAEAEEMARMLEDAGIWCEVLEDPEPDFEYPFDVSVREVDLMKAIAVVEESGELGE